jgi:hypothetical protein
MIGVKQQPSGKFISYFRDGQKVRYCGTFLNEWDAALARAHSIRQSKQGAASALSDSQSRRLPRGTTGVTGVCVKRRPNRPDMFECRRKIAGKVESFGVYNTIEKAAAVAKKVDKWKQNGCVGPRPSYYDE